MENTEQHFQNRPDTSLDSRRLSAKKPPRALVFASALLAGIVSSEGASGAQEKIPASRVSTTESTRPSEAEGEAVVRRMVTEQSNRLLRLWFFKKMDGIQIDPLHYEMWYLLGLHITPDVPGNMKMGAYFFASQCSMGPAFIDSHPLVKGTSITLKGSLKFIKTEKGWRQEGDEDLEYLTAYENAHKSDCDRIPPRVSENQK